MEARLKPAGRPKLALPRCDHFLQFPKPNDIYLNSENPVWMIFLQEKLLRDGAEDNGKIKRIHKMPREKCLGVFGKAKVFFGVLEVSRDTVLATQDVGHSLILRRVV